MKKTKKAVLALVREQGPAVEFREMMRVFGVHKGARREFKAFIDEMTDAGELVRLKGNRYGLPRDEDLVAGRLSTHRDGYGFVIPDEGGEDIFIPARYLRENLHGDRVEVRIVERGRGGKREGRIARTLQRGATTIVGRYEERRSYAVVVPDEQRISHDIVIPRAHAKGAKPGQVVLAEIVSFPTESRPPEGRVAEVIGWPDDPDVEVMTVVRKYGLPYEFDKSVLAEAQAAAKEPGEEERRGRVDLRGLMTVTIDGETARDFDDAVSVRREEKGIRLWVSIADVSHYVRPGTELDREAYLRGTSVYFPDRAIPMLPEELSNGICSLNPRVDRLSMTAEMLFDRKGVMLESDFYPSVINSNARLTYTIVKKIVVDGDAEASAGLEEIVPHLTLMKELALGLTEKRRRRGSIDFDLPEPQIVLDIQGRMEGIVRAERNLAHRIIEEFMLAANEAVASAVEKKGLPFLYRVHEPPDFQKLRDFAEFIFNFGYTLKLGEDEVDPGELQKLLDKAEGKPEERMINEVLLRTMKQARYSADNLGHFGLASNCYTHFTSPIRRYPDLVVHRVLRKMLTGGINDTERSRLEAELPETARHTSQRERTAMEAEREIVALKKIRYMQERIGEEFDGIITGVAAFGFFVELIDLFVEGMVHVSTLKRDYYTYFEKQHSLIGSHTGEVFRIGDKVRVRVAAASLEKKQIEFVVADGHEARIAAPGEVSQEEHYERVPVRGKRPSRGVARKPEGEAPGEGGRGKRPHPGKGGKAAGQERGRRGGKPKGGR